MSLPGSSNESGSSFLTFHQLHYISCCVGDPRNTANTRVTFQEQKNTQGPRKILRNKYLPQGNFFIHSWVPTGKAEYTFHYFRKFQLTQTELGLSHVCQVDVQKKLFSVPFFPGFPQNWGAQCKAVIQGEWHMCDFFWVHILTGLPYPFQGLGPRI